MQPEFINLDSSESQYKAANGVYKLIPYYQKSSPELSPTDFQSSRFIIHKHVITGQWQLTEFDAYPCSRNIKAFPVVDEHEKTKLIANHSLAFYQSLENQERIIENLKEELKAKDDSIQSLTSQNESLLDMCFTDLSDETIKDTEAYTQLEGALFEKEKKMNEANRKFKETLFEKENEILGFKKKLKVIIEAYTQLEEALFEKEKKMNEANRKFEETLFEKENEILEFKKKLKVQFFEHEKQIVDSRAEFQKTIIKVKTEQNKMYKEKIRLMKNDMNLEQSKLKNKYWVEQETLKENLSPEKFKEKEKQINYLQNQLSKTESENNKLKMTQEILEKEKENLTNYNQNLLTQLAQEKKKFKETIALKNNTKKKQATNSATTSTPPEKVFKNIKKIDNKIRNGILSKKDINSTYMDINADLNFEEEYTTMITFLENENKSNEDELLRDLNEFYQDVNTKDYQIQRIKKIMEEDTKTLMYDPNYTYEFVLINYGALVYAKEEISKYDSYSQDVETKMNCVNEKMKNWNDAGGKFIWFTILSHVYLIHEQFEESTVPSKFIKDETLIEKLKVLMKEPQLLLEKEYRYEFMLTAIGTVMHARKEVLDEFKNVEIFSY